MAESDFYLLPQRPVGRTTGTYTGRCPISGRQFSLPRTTLAESVCLDLARTLSLNEGKMIGVLLARDRQGRLGFLKAFSGTLAGREEVTGWVSPLFFEAMPNEALRRLNDWKGQLLEYKRQLDNHPFLQQQMFWQKERERLKEEHRAAKVERDIERSLKSGRSEQELVCESQAHSRQQKRLREKAKEQLAVLRKEYQELQEALLAINKKRREYSRNLQASMHQKFADSFMGLLGASLGSLFPTGIPTGTGDCCAPKLLAYAAKEGYKPLALAEMWWGPTSIGAKRAGEFYLACAERCQPLLGPLLAVALRDPLEVLYSDRDLLVVNKPSGLLSVPGRYPWSQDSVLSRLDGQELWPVHRLDFETSGVLVLAKDPKGQRVLQGQFARREVKKIYQALLEERPQRVEGCLDLPLRTCRLAFESQRIGLENRPRYAVDAKGKPALTSFRLIEPSENRVELRPLTGRSHQLRVHMAQGLGCPIRGDGLYGRAGERLMLHALSLCFRHPYKGETVRVEAKLPF